MKNVGVTKKSYVECWVKEGKIPGVIPSEKIDEVMFPDDARRPYRGVVKEGSDAKTIRAHIIKACVARQHISARMCHMSDGEYKTMMDDLVKAGLIVVRESGGINYCDSTQKADELIPDKKAEKKSAAFELLKKALEIIMTATIQAKLMG